jgi:hypothetical protein
MQYEAGKEPPLHTRDAAGIKREFVVLPPQDVQIGTHAFYRISFATPINPRKDVPKLDFDGPLPTVLFQRVFISYTDRYAVLGRWSLIGNLSPRKRSLAVQASELRRKWKD